MDLYGLDGFNNSDLVLRSRQICLSRDKPDRLSAVHRGWSVGARLPARTTVKEVSATKRLTQVVTARPASSSPSRVQRVAFRAAHVHRPCEQMHDYVATAQDRYRNYDIDQSFFQGELSGTHASGVLCSRSLARPLRWL